jgi:hypothetical protein
MGLIDTETDAAVGAGKGRQSDPGPVLPANGSRKSAVPAADGPFAIEKRPSGRAVRHERYMLRPALTP